MGNVSDIVLCEIPSYSAEMCVYMCENMCPENNYIRLCIHRCKDILFLPHIFVIEHCYWWITSKILKTVVIWKKIEELKCGLNIQILDTFLRSDAIGLHKINRRMPKKSTQSSSALYHLLFQLCLKIHIAPHLCQHMLFLAF